MVKEESILMNIPRRYVVKGENLEGVNKQNEGITTNKGS